MTWTPRDLSAVLRTIIDNMDFAVNDCVATDHAVPDNYWYARKRYSDYITFAAGKRRNKYGFGWQAVHDSAPDTYATLIAEFQGCMNTLKPFRVWSGASDKTVFTSPQINHAFRFVHDTDHVILGADLTHDGEVKVIVPFIMEVFHAAGFVAAVLCACDLLGQLWYGTNNHGAFVDDQEAFVKQLYSYLMHHHGAQHG